MTGKVFSRSSQARLLGFAALLPFLLGCSGSRRAAYEAVPIQESDRIFVEEWSQVYPKTFKMVQRIVLVVGEKQYDFVGYLLMRRPGAFRALGLGEMGGRIFDFEAVDGRFQILQKPEAIPPKPLIDGVAGDILHLFDGAPLEGWKAGRDKDGGRLIVWNLGENRALECLIAKEGNRPEESRETRGRRIVRKARYSDWKTVSGWDRPIPGHIVLENLRWNYRMEIEVLECEPLRALRPGEALPAPEQAGRPKDPLLER